MKSKKHHNELWEADYRIDEMKGKIPSNSITESRKAPSGKRLTRVEVHLHIDTPILVQPTSDSLLQIISQGLGRLIAAHILGQSNMRELLMAKTEQSRHNKNSNNRRATI